MKNDTPTLTLENSDIIDRVNRRYMISIIITVLWCLAVLIAIFVFNVGADSVSGTATLITSIAIPVFLLEPYRIIFDRNWAGTVKSVKRKDKPYKSKTPLVLDSTSITPIITIIIELSNGEVMVKRYKLKRDRYQYAEALVDYYKAGTVVHCYKGLKYLKKDPNIIQVNKFDHRLCIVCGNFGDWNHKECKHCKSTFVE